MLFGNAVWECCLGMLFGNVMVSTSLGLLPLAEIFAAGLFFALFLAGGFCCGLIMLGRLLETLFRRLPWQPSLFIYGLGVAACLPAFMTTNGHGNSAALLRLNLHYLARALPPALAGWLDIGVFGLPFLFSWAAWALCRLENPAPKGAPAAERHSPSETVWPPPPVESVKPPSPPKPRKTRERR